jgi:5-formyltetrahydrofolate cyclo-ligase
MGAQEDKARLRGEVAQRRKALSDDWMAAASAAAQQRILNLPEFGAAGVVACYLAIRGEVCTDRIVQACRKTGKKVALPARRTDGRYSLALWREGEPLADGPLGTREPAARLWMPGTAVEFWVVPGVAFDADGGRVGHGRGHYDRLLAGARGGARPGFAAGLAFDLQVFDRVPAENWDARMDVVVTEMRTLRRAT